MMSLFMSGSKSSSVLVHFRKGELALGVVIMASQDVASFSLSSASSSGLKFLKEGGVTDSVRSMFSLSELMQSDLSKNLGLYSCSVGLGHGPESEVMLFSFFQGVNTPGSFQETYFPSLIGFFQSRNFSVQFSMSSTKV